MVHITSHISGHRKTLLIKPEITENDQNKITWNDIYHTIIQNEGSYSDVFLMCEGKPVGETDTFEGNANIVATLRLRGGKGGFGSMLRAIGAQIEKTTNREACRDLSGRRLRDINEEKRLKDYLAKKVEKEKEMLELKRKKLEQLKEGPKHIFEDKSYFEQREKREQDIYDSLDKAFSSSSGAASSSSSCSSSSKTGSDGAGSSSRKKPLKNRLFEDLDDSSSEEDSDVDTSSSREGEGSGVEGGKTTERLAAKSEDEDGKGETEEASNVNKEEWREVEGKKTGAEEEEGGERDDESPRNRSGKEKREVDDPLRHGDSEHRMKKLRT